MNIRYMTDNISQVYAAIYASEIPLFAILQTQKTYQKAIATLV